MKKSDMANCLIELKSLIRNVGRTNIITPREIDEIFVKHNINLKKLEEMVK